MALTWGVSRLQPTRAQFPFQMVGPSGCEVSPLLKRHMWFHWRGSRLFSLWPPEPTEMVQFMCKNLGSDSSWGQGPVKSSHFITAFTGQSCCGGVVPGHMSGV